MKNKEFELIKEMLQMQAKLDESIMSAHGLTEIDEESLRMAILDEVGELTHELKGDWCWWKRTQAPVDNDKVLGELVDIWHFVLNYQNRFNGGEKGILNASMFEINSSNILNLLMTNEYKLSETLTDLSTWNSHKMERLVAISEYLGFTIEQVYKAYCDKNKVNYQRLKEGY